MSLIGSSITDTVAAVEFLKKHRQEHVHELSDTGWRFLRRAEEHMDAYLKRALRDPLPDRIMAFFQRLIMTGEEK